MPISRLAISTLVRAALPSERVMDGTAVGRRQTREPAVGLRVATKGPPS